MSTSIPRSPLPSPASGLLPAATTPGVIWRAVTAIITGFVAVGAYFGAWYLTDDAAVREIPVPPPDFLPGVGWGFGALALLVLVAAPMTIACLAAALGHRSAAGLALVAGVLLMGWIVVQVLLIGLIFWLQPASFLMGAVVAAMGLGGYHPTVNDTSATR